MHKIKAAAQDLRLYTIPKLKSIFNAQITAIGIKTIKGINIIISIVIINFFIILLSPP